MILTIEIIIKICSWIGIIYTVLKAYQFLYYLGVFKRKKFKESNNYHSYGICIAARNEEKVIRNLLESISRQDYPKNKIKIFIVADNCSDNTANIVESFIDEMKEKNASNRIETYLYVHNNENERTKGFALKYLFEKIKENHWLECEAFLIFDADNILSPSYLSKINNPYDLGHDVVVSLRNSKNATQNWISFSYAIHWLRTCLTHRGVTLLNMPCRIQGTGFLFDKKYVENGWTYTSLTEDRAFSTDIVLRGGSITYCEDAVFYDEQPYKLSVALKQRLRWSKGHLQSAVENCPKLIKNIFSFNNKTLPSYEMLWINFPTAIESLFRNIISYLCQIIMGIIISNAYGAVYGILTSILIGYGFTWLKGMFESLFVYAYYHKYLPKLTFGRLLFYTVMFPFFDLIGKFTYYVALFKKVEWHPCPHDYAMKIDNLHSNMKK